MKRRIETKVSQTAEIMCVCRMISYYEDNPLLKSGDYVAAQIIPPLKRRILKSRWFKKLFLSKTPPGAYEYVVARTKYIDNIFQNMDDSFEQVLILGAGFDSRALRFQAQLAGSIVYEVDAPNTQAAKIKQYGKGHFEVPSNLKFVAIDFEKEMLGQKLLVSGFQAGSKDLVLMEGLTMYLDAQSIDKLFSLISQQIAEGSLVVFDYVHASVIRGEGDYYGEFEIKKQVTKSAEPWTFGIEDDQIESFLASHGLALVDRAEAAALEQRFLTSGTGHSCGRVNGTHCLVTARKK
jgi:methyltransferase (TIGR00027 family)